MSSLPAPRKCGSVSLTVLPQNGSADAPRHDKRTIRKSRAGKWRAAVLIGVHVLFAIHLALWFVSGMRDGVRETLSPVEPSESMYTLEGGLVNAGFIFFLLAILSTIIFGRFFCGWGCHIVALQDLCGWIMKKCGVHPRPFRSRLLVFVPLVVALYMFVWPTFKREVLVPLVADGDHELWSATYGLWFGESASFPGWTDHLIVEDFWKTFAPWYVAIPFIFICTFGVVYFLGNKGFCTYACPYGGFFGPADKVSFGKIKVNDNCEGCGHCTAVCSSNVRVHEEVRDFGMVVDPGCMKCMDCVSVCPNDALSFGFGKPSVLTKPRPEAELRRAEKKRHYDLAWPEELLLAFVFLGLTIGFRGMLNEVPLLMALGMAGIGTFLAWKLIQLVREKNTRIHGFQLKLKGKLRPAAFAFIPITVAFLSMAGWSGWVKYQKRAGELTASVLEVPSQQLLTPGFVADEKSRETARRALSHFQRAGSPREGGWGWRHRPDELQTIGYLHLVLGDIPATERTLLDIMERGNPLDALVFQLRDVMYRRGATDDEVLATLHSVLKSQPQLSDVRKLLAGYYVSQSRADDAIKLYEEGLAARPGDPAVRRDFGVLLVQLNQLDRGLELLREATEIARGERPGMRVRRDPHALMQIAGAYYQIGRPELGMPILEHLATLKKTKRPPAALPNLAWAQFSAGKPDDAIATMKRAAAENPEAPDLLLGVAEMYRQQNRAAEAAEWTKRGVELQNKLQQQFQQRIEKIRVWRAAKR